MRWLLISLGAITVVAASGYAVATGGVPDREPPSWLNDRVVAHRGEWTEGPERPENSLAAFRAATRNGYAIELDVHLTTDGVPVVIHDDDLRRMTGEPGKVSEMTLAQAKQRRLLGGEERIPTLDEVLEQVDGRVPVFVEIKNDGEVGELEGAVAGRLAAYEGESAVMSFNPFSLAGVAEGAPEVPRGQLSSALEGEDLAFYEVFLLKHLLMNWKSRPDFIAYDLNELPTLGTTMQRWRGRPLIGWTAKTDAERVEAERIVDGVIADPEALP